MATDIRVPALGESVREATVAKWLKKPGEPVALDEAVLELETDKVSLEVNAPVAGVLAEILAEAGQNVEVGALLGRLEAGGAIRADSAAKPPPPPPLPSPSFAPPQPTLPPAARKLVAEQKLDPAMIPGTGKDGRITKNDVLTHVAAAQASPPVSPPAITAPREERVRMTRLRQRIAERLKQAQDTAAMLTTFNEVDMTAAMGLRTQFNEAFEKKHGVKLGFMSIFVKAAIAALKLVPAVNGEIDGTDLVYKNYYDIGVAVGTGQGLVVPVLRDADAMGFAAIEKQIAALAKRARDGKLTMDELSGGTFTITNGGIYGSLNSTPILNPPQSGILGMHKIQKRPVVISEKGADRIEIRPMMYIALSYDHRIVDGREAVTFLVAVKDAVEDPQRLLLDL